MKSREKYLFKNTMVFAIGSIGTKMIAFFLVPLYTNTLNTSEYGIADLIYTIGTVLVPLLTLNISEAIMRFALDKDANYDRIMNIGVIFLTIATVAGSVIFPVAEWFGAVKGYGGYIYFYTVSLAYSQVMLYYLRGKEELLKYSIGNIVHAVMIAILNIAFLKLFKWGLHGYFLAYIIANLITALYAFAVGHVGSTFKGFSLDKILCRNMLKYSVVLIPNSLMWWIMNSSDRVMLTSMMGTTANGIFAVSYKIPTLLTTLTTIFNQAWCYSAIREDESTDRDLYYNQVFENLVAFILSGAAFILAIIKPFMKIYIAADYYVAWEYTPYLIIGFVFLTIATFLSSTYTVNKDSKGFLYSGTCGALLNIVLNWILIKRIGIAGAAIATAVGYIVVFVYRVVDTKKYVKINLCKLQYIMALIILFAMAATVYIDHMIGQCMLIAEFLIMALLFRKALTNIIAALFKRFKKK